MKCPTFGGYFDMRDLGQVFEHEGPLPHPLQDQRSRLRGVAAMSISPGVSASLPKLDGWRLQAVKDGSGVTLYCRHGRDLTSRFLSVRRRI